MPKLHILSKDKLRNAIKFPDLAAIGRKLTYAGAFFLAFVVCLVWMSLGVTLLWMTCREIYGPADPDRIRNLAFTVAAVWGVPLILWRTWVAERQTRTAEKNRLIAAAGLNAERLSKATEQLGAARPDDAPNIEARCGAIFSLERLAEDGGADRWIVLKIIESYTGVRKD